MSPTLRPLSIHTRNPPTIIQPPARCCEGVCEQPGSGLSGQRFTAECAALLPWWGEAGGRPPLSRYYSSPSNIHQLLGDLRRPVNVIGQRCAAVVGVVVCPCVDVRPHDRDINCARMGGHVFRGWWVLLSPQSLQFTVN